MNATVNSNFKEISSDENSRVYQLIIDNFDDKNKEVSIEVKLAGNLNSKNGLVLFHGATLTYKIMEMLTPVFADRKLIFMNAPGRGLSSGLMEPNLDKYAKCFNIALRKLAENGEFDTLDMIGYSMGGPNGIKTALLGGLNVKHFIFLCSGARVDPDCLIGLAAKKIVKGEISSTDPNCLNVFPENGFGPNTPKEFIDATLAAMPDVSAPLEAAVTDVLNTTGVNYNEDIPNLDKHIKVLFLLGNSDRLFCNADSLTTIYVFKKAGINTRVNFYEGMGHIDFPLWFDDDQKTGAEGIISNMVSFLSK